MSAQFQGKRALVTGGNKGIGFAICQGLLAVGFDVILAARSRSVSEGDSLDKAKAAIEQLQSSNIRAVELDVNDDDSIDAAAKNLGQEIDSLDVLINNAGIYPDQSVNILTVSRELLNQTMNVNAFGAVRVTQAFLPLLMKSAAARVINTSSGYGQLSGLSADAPTYCLSKLALNGVTIMLAKALQTKGIVVNALDPGWVKTDMGSGAAPRSPEQGDRGNLVSDRSSIKLEWKTVSRAPRSCLLNSQGNIKNNQLNLIVYSIKDDRLCLPFLSMQLNNIMIRLGLV